MPAPVQPAAQCNKVTAAPQSPELRRLADYVAHRIGALRCAYAALRRAHELSPAPHLRSTTMAVLFELAEARANLAELRLLERSAGLEIEP
jgi:hypothetical protein